MYFIFHVTIIHRREGLAVKVAFGDVWKESLSELSGGQRSLLALSLILSLLLAGPLVDPFASSFQACSHVHSGRGRCST
jgi:sorbitol-specific phosphotransferase system component IIBC